MNDNSAIGLLGYVTAFRGFVHIEGDFAFGHDAIIFGIQARHIAY
jgi:hypothetical protein